MIFDLYTTLLLEAQPQRTVLTRAMSRVYGMDNPIGDPFGGAAYGEYNTPVVRAVESIGRAIDKAVLHPIYREVIQPVGKALEKIGQGIAKDPLTFIAQAAAVALAPVTAGQSLWALPVIAAASTAAKGGSMDQILTATAISAATAAVGGGFGMENSVGGLIMNGLQTGGSVAAGTATYGIMGTSITATTAQAISTAGTGLAMGAIQAGGAAAQGKDPFMAALPSLVGSALGFAGNMAGQSEFFAPISDALKDISTNVSPIVSKAMTGVASAMITGAITGKDMTQVALASLANTAVSGLVSASNVVAQFFTNDEGGVTKLGTATQSIVADLLGSVAATVASGGKMGTAMGAQFLANATKTLTPFLNPEFDAMATDVQATYKKAEAKVNALNNAANAQQRWINKYNGDVSKLNSLADTINADVTERDRIVKLYNAATTQADVNKYKAEFDAIESRIASNTASYNRIYDTIDDTNASYLASVKATEAAQKDYFEISKVLGNKGTQLSTKMNEITKELTLTAAKTFDPNFNPEEYKQLNNLGANMDAATHFLSVGKDQGLFTNIAAAETQRDTLIDKATEKLFRANGWGSITQVPEEVYNATRDRIANYYGNNMQGLSNFTVANLVAQSKMPATWYAPMWDEDTKTITEAKVLFNNDPTAKEGQVVIADTVLPKGMSVASFYDIQNGNANITRGNDGNFYWTTNQGTSAKIYDPKTGEIVNTTYSTYFNDKDVPAGATNISRDEYGRVTGYTDANGVMSIVVRGTNNDQAEYKDYGTPLGDLDGLTQMYTYANVNDGIAANFNVKGIVQASKEVVDYMQKDATDIQKLQVATIVKSAGSVAQDVGTVLGDLATTIGLTKTNNNALTDIGKQLQGLAEAKTPQQYKDAMADINAMRANAQGTDIASVNAAIAAKYPDLVGVSVFGGELFEEVIQNGIGKAAFVAGGALAATLGAPALITAGVASAFGYGTAMALDFAESYRGGKEDMYQRMYDIYKEKGYSDYQAKQMADAAASKAGVMNGLITLAVNGAAPGDINKVLFGGKASPAQEAITNYFLDKVGTMVKVGVSEAVQGGVEGFLQGAYNESIVYSVDPKKADYWKGITDSAMLESIIGAPVAMGAYGASNVFDAAKQTFTFANEAFTDAITNPNVKTIGELGSIVNQWVPSGDSESAQTFKNAIVAQVMEAVPTLSVNYSNAGAYIDAIKNSFGVYETVAADIANADPKFADKVTSTSEAAKLLESRGLANVTTEDAAKAGIVGGTKTNQAALADTYVNQNMVSQAELEAAAKQENYTYTQAELDKLVGRGVEAQVIQKFVQEIDPKAVTTAEATQWFKNEGYTKFTAQELAQFVKSAPETEVQAALTAYIDPHQVTRTEAIKFYAQNGIVPTEAQINKYVVHGADVAEADVAKQLAAYADPMYVSADEVRQAYKDLGVTAPITMSDIARLTGQYDESQLAAKAKESLPVVASNASYAAMVGDKYAMQSVKDAITGTADKIKALGYTDSEAQSAAIDVAAAQFGVNRANLLSALGTTEQNAALDLNPTTDTIIAKIEQYVNRGMTPQNAVTAALDTVAQGQGITANQLLTKLGTTAGDFVTYATPKIDTTESALAEAVARNETSGMTYEAALQKAANDVATRFDIPVADVLTKIDTTSQQFQNKINIAQTDLDKQLVTISGGTQTATGQIGQMEAKIKQVADLVGKPASQVTTADITNVQNMLANKTATNLAYDVNQDGKVDTQDLTLIQQQQKIETKQDVETKVDQTTGQTVYIDKTTGQPISGFSAPEGSVWAPTGIYGEIAKNAAAQQKQAKEAQKKQNFGQMMQMVLGASDVNGRKVTVDTPPPSRINYIYDFSSIFATPQQSGLFPSPYGAINTYGQPTQQGLGSLQTGMRGGQAANQGIYGEPYKMAVGGFAEGGMINSDISVGDGGNLDDLLNILKGNSG